MAITAYQDRGCLSASKYIYRFSMPIQETIVESFSGCDIRALRFSTFVASARDLLKIGKKNAFQADVILQGFTTTVYFAEIAAGPLARLIDGFDQHLYNAGYGAVEYLAAPKPRCDQCPARHLKGCASFIAHPDRGDTISDPPAVTQACSAGRQQPHSPVALKQV